MRVINECCIPCCLTEQKEMLLLNVCLFVGNLNSKVFLKSLTQVNSGATWTLPHSPNAASDWAAEQQNVLCALLSIHSKIVVGFEANSTSLNVHSSPANYLIKVSFYIMCCRMFYKNDAGTGKAFARQANKRAAAWFFTVCLLMMMLTNV